MVHTSSSSLWLSNEALFHRGTSGQWRPLMDEAGLRRCQARVEALVASDVAAWAHGGWLGSDLSLSAT